MSTRCRFREWGFAMTDVLPDPRLLGGISRDPAPTPALSDTPIAGSRYSSREFMEKEWEGMWTKVWLVAARVDQVPDAGDYVNYKIGRESILCVRGSDGRIRAFYNVCQHRGNQLVTAEVGSLGGGEFQCAYHGWRFADTGRLNWVYCEEDFPQGSPCGKRNLAEIPCDTWGGFIWINMDEGCMSLQEYLEPIAGHLDTYRMENMKRTHWVTLEADFNWKCIQDNFNESYHLAFVHPQLGSVMHEYHTECQFDMYETGHARMLMPGGGPGPQYQGKAQRTFERLQQTFEYWDFDPTPYADDLVGLRAALQRRKRELGASKGYDFSYYSDDQLTDNYHYTFFPNLSLSMKPDGSIFLMGRPHPTDPQKCIFDMWYLTMFPEGATEYFANSVRQWVNVDDQAEHQTRAGVVRGDGGDVLVVDGLAAIR